MSIPSFRAIDEFFGECGYNGYEAVPDGDPDAEIHINGGAGKFFARARDIKFFNDSELKSFTKYSRFLVSNPRKIKRITNIYLTAKFLAHGALRSTPGLSEKLLIWTILLEQWPVRMSWLLQILEDDELSPKRCLASKHLLIDCYKKLAEGRVHNLKLDYCPEKIALSYRNVHSLDSDSISFDTLLRLSALTVGDVGNLNDRNEKMLMTYTLNMNPSLRSLIATIADCHETTQTFLANNSNYFRRTGRLTLMKRNVDLSCEELLSWLRRPEQGVSDEFIEQIESNAINGRSFEELLSQQSVVVQDLKLSSLRYFNLKSNWHDFDATLLTAAAESQRTVDILLSEESNNEGSEADGGMRGLGRRAATMRHKSVGEFGLNSLFEIPEENEERGFEGGSLRDGINGHDHIGYIKYAEVLAALIHHGVETPVIFGLYANWGTGKSFIMNKIERVSRMLWLHNIVESNLNSRKIMGGSKMNAQANVQMELSRLLGTEDSMLEILCKWYLMSCPIEAYNYNEESLMIDKVEEMWDERNADFSVYTEVFSKFLWPVCFLMYVLVCGFWWRKSVRETRTFLMKSSTLIGRLYQSVHTKVCIPDDQKEANDIDCDFKYIRWNAWLYSGSDNLWAGLIKALYDSVEDHFGGEYTHAQEKARALTVFVNVVLTLLFAGITYSILHSNSFHVDSKIIISIVTVVVSIATAVNAWFSYMAKIFRDSEKIVAEVSSEEFRNRVGFMATVKNKLEEVGKMLNNVEELPNLWDYFIPDYFGHWKAPIKSMLSKMNICFGPKVPRKKNCKFIIFVDDLDRCDPIKAVEVLQSLILLTEGTPFVIVLAVDPRILVTAIETVHSEFFSSAGVTGYEYLDKIVQIPFSIPKLVNDEKVSLCYGYVKGTPETTQGAEENIESPVTENIQPAPPAPMTTEPVPTMSARASPSFTFKKSAPSPVPSDDEEEQFPYENVGPPIEGVFD